MTLWTVVCQVPLSRVQKIKNVDDIQPKVHFLHPLHRLHPNSVIEYPSRISVCCVHKCKYEFPWPLPSIHKRQHSVSTTHAFFHNVYPDSESARCSGSSYRRAGPEGCSGSFTGGSSDRKTGSSAANHKFLSPDA